jgi:hypothetical protein
LKAFEYIDTPSKWTRGAYIRGNDRVCAVGAFVLSLGVPRSELLQYEYLMDAEKELKRLLVAAGRLSPGGYPSEWNDASTWETVYRTLKELDI